MAMIERLLLFATKLAVAQILSIFSHFQAELVQAITRQRQHGLVWLYNENCSTH